MAATSDQIARLYDALDEDDYAALAAELERIGTRSELAIPWAECSAEVGGQRMSPLWYAARVRALACFDRIAREGFDPVAWASLPPILRKLLESEFEHSMVWLAAASRALKGGDAAVLLDAFPRWLIVFASRDATTNPADELSRMRSSPVNNKVDTLFEIASEMLRTGVERGVLASEVPRSIADRGERPSRRL